MATFTRKAIMQTFLHILKNKPLDRITVKDICEQCEINRNTFYYYYSDIYELLEDALKTKVKSKLRHISDYDSLYDAYIHSIAPFVSHKQIIQHIYNSKAKDSFEDYIRSIINGYMRKFVITYAVGYSLCEDDIEYISSFYTYAITGSLINDIKTGMNDMTSNYIKNISDTFNATIIDMIRQRLESRQDVG